MCIFSFAGSFLIAFCTSWHSAVYQRRPGGAHGMEERGLHTRHRQLVMHPQAPGRWRETFLHHQKMRLFMRRYVLQRMGLWALQDGVIILTLPLCSHGFLGTLSNLSLCFCTCKMEQYPLPPRANMRILWDAAHKARVWCVVLGRCSTKGGAVIIISIPCPGNSSQLDFFKSSNEQPQLGVSARSLLMQKFYVFTCKLLVETIPLGWSKGQHGGNTALHLLCDSIL